MKAVFLIVSFLLLAFWAFLSLAGETVICPRCQAVVNENYKECWECGFDLQSVSKDDGSYIGYDHKTVHFFSAGIGLMYSTILKQAEVDACFPVVFDNINQIYALHIMPYYSKREDVNSLGLNSYFQFFLLHESKIKPHVGVGMLFRTYFDDKNVVLEFIPIPRFGVFTQIDERGSFVDPYFGYGFLMHSNLRGNSSEIIRGFALGVFSNYLFTDSFGVGGRMEMMFFPEFEYPDRFTLSCGPTLVF